MFANNFMITREGEKKLFSVAHKKKGFETDTEEKFFASFEMLAHFYLSSTRSFS